MPSSSPLEQELFMCQQVCNTQPPFHTPVFCYGLILGAAHTLL